MPSRFAKSVTFDAPTGLFVLKEMPPAHQWIVDLLALTFGNEAIRIPLAEDLGRRQVVGVVSDAASGGLVIRDDAEKFDINHEPQLVLDWIKEMADDKGTS